MCLLHALQPIAAAQTTAVVQVYASPQVWTKNGKLGYMIMMVLYSMETYFVQSENCICAWCPDNRCNTHWQAPESMHAYWHGHEDHCFHSVMNMSQ